MWDVSGKYPIANVGRIPYHAPMDREKLISEIEAFAEATGLAESTIGGRAVKDSRFVSRLRDGKAVTFQNVERLRDFMRGYRATRRSATSHEARA